MIQPSHTLLIILISFLCGVAARSLYEIPLILALGISVGALALFTSSIFHTKGRGKQIVRLVSLVSFMLVIGIIRVEVYERSLPLISHNLIGAKVELSGLVRSPPEERATNARFVFETDEKIRLLATVPIGTDIQYGSRIQVVGMLELAETIESDDGRIFHYDQYLKTQNIHGLLRGATIVSTELPSQKSVQAHLFSVRDKLIDSMRNLFPEEESGLLAGIILGLNGALSPKLEEQFRTVGLIHIVVLSGSNVQIIAQTFRGMFSFLQRDKALIATAICLVLFACMVGMSATVVRATCMALISLLADGVRRDYDVIRALLVTLFIMVMVNPVILIYDPAFQLSFLATLGLVFLSPLLEKYFLWCTEKYGMREYLVSSIATQIFVTPFIIYLIGSVSLISLVVNMLILPFVPLTMLIGFLAVLGSFLSEMISTPLAFIAHLLMEYELLVVEWFAAIPYAALRVRVVPFWSCFLAYSVFTVWLYRLGRISRLRLPSSN